MKLNEREPYQNNIIRKGLEWNWFVAQLLSALIKQKHSLLLSFSPFVYSQIAIDFCSTSLSQWNGTNTTPFSPYQGDGRKKRADGGNLRLCAHITFGHSNRYFANEIVYYYYKLMSEQINYPLSIHSFLCLSVFSYHEHKHSQRQLDHFHNFMLRS